MDSKQMARHWSCPECGSKRTHCYSNRQYPEDHLLICFGCGVASVGNYHPRFSRHRPEWVDSKELDRYELILEGEVGEQEGMLEPNAEESIVFQRIGFNYDA